MNGTLRRNLGMSPDNHCQCKFFMMTIDGPHHVGPIVAWVYAPDADNALRLTRAHLLEQGRPQDEVDRLTARPLGSAGLA